MHRGSQLCFCQLLPRTVLVYCCQLLTSRVAASPPSQIFSAMSSAGLVHAVFEAGLVLLCFQQTARVYGC